MFVAQALSFQKQARLAISLSWIAGYTNILTILACGQVSSHVSGTASQLGRDVAEGRWRTGAYMAALLVVFLSGAALSGFLTEMGRHRRWGSIYLLPMAVEALLLAAFAVLVGSKPSGDVSGTSAGLWLTLLPSFAMGIQNATITRISGGTVRTTHVTGVMSDLGMESAVWLIRRARGEHRDVPRGMFATGWRLLLLGSIVGSFTLGAALGAFAFDEYPAWSMAPAVAFLAFIVAIDLWSPIASPRSNKDIGGDLQESLPDSVAVYHIATTVHRFGRRSHMPNLVLWAEGLEPAVRVVVLDLSGVDTLDANALIELKLASERLVAEGRTLVLAGVTPRRFAKFGNAGVFRSVEASNVCSDIELAAAHAMSLVDATPESG